MKNLRSRYELCQLKDTAPREIPAKRKRDHRGAAVTPAAGPAAAGPSPLVPPKSRCPSEYTFGKLNVREFVQRLHAAGFADARVEGGDDGGGGGGGEYTIIHLVSRSVGRKRGGPTCGTAVPFLSRQLEQCVVRRTARQASHCSCLHAATERQPRSQSSP